MMDDITNDRLASGPREREINCGNCKYWVEAEITPEIDAEEELGDYTGDYTMA